MNILDINLLDYVAQNHFGTDFKYEPVSGSVAAVFPDFTVSDTNRLHLPVFVGSLCGVASSPVTITLEDFSTLVIPASTSFQNLPLLKIRKVSGGGAGMLFTGFRILRASIPLTDLIDQFVVVPPQLLRIDYGFEEIWAEPFNQVIFIGKGLQNFNRFMFEGDYYIIADYAISHTATEIRFKMPDLRLQWAEAGHVGIETFLVNPDGSEYWPDGIQFMYFQP